MIGGVVLSAGRSSRMGSPKALLELDGVPFLARIIEALQAGGCEPVVVVAGSGGQAESERIGELARSLGAFVAVNPDPGSEQVESLRIAVRSMPEGVQGVVVTPVDSPCIASGIVAKLVEAGTRGASVAVPAIDGRRGHPILFAGVALRELFEELPEGARTLIRRHSADLVEIPAGTRDILLDIDTPQDYRNLRERSE